MRKTRMWLVRKFHAAPSMNRSLLHPPVAFLLWFASTSCLRQEFWNFVCSFFHFIRMYIWDILFCGLYFLCLLCLWESPCISVNHSFYCCIAFLCMKVKQCTYCTLDRHWTFPMLAIKDNAYRNMFPVAHKHICPRNMHRYGIFKLWLNSIIYL